MLRCRRGLLRAEGQETFRVRPDVAGAVMICARCAAAVHSGTARSGAPSGLGSSFEIA
jgi:hypothetical protein